MPKQYARRRRLCEKRNPEQKSRNAKKRNIAVTNTPDVLTDATAEIAMLLILGACRRANEGVNWVKKENWKWSSDFLIGIWIRISLT